MAACGSLQHIFDNKPLDPPPSPPLFDPSCTHINSIKPIDGSITDVFTGLDLSDTSSSVTTDQHRRSVSLSSSNSESLSEALGFESFDDVETFTDQREQQRHEDRQRQSVAIRVKHARTGETRRSRISGKEIPPPISSIGRRVCFKSYRYNGRLILKEVKIPTQELLHAYREDGRLKLQFVQFDDEVETESGNGEKVGAKEVDDDDKNMIREE